MKTCLIVFAKNPIPNQVKTRLLPRLSAEQAALLYRAFLSDWWAALAELPNINMVIAYTPPEGLHDIQQLIGKDVTYIPQEGADLGTRLISATRWAVDREYEKILIVGSDSPTLPLSYISEAVIGLDLRDIVIGPSMDGGYYLIGFTTQNFALIVPSIFENIAWSTSHVFQQTLERIQTIEVTLQLLPPWYDIDTPDDLAFLHTHLSAMRLAEGKVQAIRTENLLTELLKENELWDN